jgi:predicted Zn-dependent protease
MRQERFELAMQLLDSPSGHPLQRPELMAATQALLRLPPHPARPRITQQLREQVTQAPLDAQAWNTLASMHALQGQMLPALRAEGEAQMARMDWPGAVDRFRAAQDWAKNNRLQAGDHIEASIVDTRLRQAQAQIKAMQNER